MYICMTYTHAIHVNASLARILLQYMYLPKYQYGQLHNIQENFVNSTQNILWDPLSLKLY